MKLDRGEAARGALLVLVPLAVLFVVSGRAHVPLLAGLALAVGLVLAWLASRHPQAAVLIAMAVVAVIPFYDGRLVTRAMAITPMTACCFVLFPVAFASRGRVRLGAIDLAFGLYVLFRCLGLLTNFHNGFGALFLVLLQAALPYAVFRCLTTGPALLHKLAPVVVITAVGLAGVGIAEHANVPNPFFTLLPAQYQAAQWAHAETRDHSIRAEGSFGHPIAFGMYLALALVLALAMALVVRSVVQRLVLVGACGVIVLGLADSLSRGPLIVGALGTVTWVLASVRRLNIIRLVTVLALATGLVVGTPVLAIVQHLISASATSDSREGLSTQYRLEIFAVARDPAEFSLLGRTNDEGNITEAVFQRTGLTSIDSEFALVYLTAGLLSLLAFTAVVVLVIKAAALPDLTHIERAWAIALGATCLNLTTVALLTQHGELFWSWTAMVAGLVQRHQAHTEARELEHV